MCYPMLIAAAAMAAAGAAASAHAQEVQGQSQASAMDAQTERNKALRAEAETKDGSLRDQSNNTLTAAIQNAGQQAQTAQTQTAADTRQAAYDKATAPTMPLADYLPTSQGAPSVVKDQVGAALQGAIDRAKTLNAAKANLEGFGDAQLGQNIALGRSGQQVGLFGNFRRGQQGVYDAGLGASNVQRDADMTAAQTAGAGWRTLGGALTTGGSLMASGAGYGAGGGWNAQPTGAGQIR